MQKRTKVMGDCGASVHSLREDQMDGRDEKEC